MTDEIQLIKDRDGLAVFGREAAVERFLRASGLWAASRDLDLRRLRATVAVGSEVVNEATKFTSQAGRWVKLTEESARLVQEHGLMASKTPGVDHLMVGTPGNIRDWLQREQSQILANPQLLAGVSGVMAQVAAQQNIAEIREYLERIDEKVDDVLRKVDETVLKSMVGARLQIRRASTMRDQEGRVSDDAWSEVQDASGKVADVQGYALLQLKAIAEKFEGQTRVSGLASATEEAKREVAKWLAVLADCAQLQEAFDILAVDRVLEAPADQLNARRRGLAADRLDRLDLIARYTEDLLARMDEAVSVANAKLFWNRAKAPTVIESSTQVAVGVHEFHTLLGIDAAQRSWEQRRLGRAAEIGAQVVQKTKTVTPYVAAVGALAVSVVAVHTKAQGDSESS